MRRLTLFLRRFVVFAIGAVCVWLIAFVIFDAADNRLPRVLAAAVTYGLGAYVVLPRAVRIGLRVLKQGRVPSYTLTGDGLPGDPINIALIGSYRDLAAAFAKAGWTEAEKLGFASSLRMVRSFLLNRPYPDAPFSTLFLFDRGQDVGFQLPIGDSPRKRHHVRFWGLPAQRVRTTLRQPEFWLGSIRPADEEQALWVGAATRDTGFSLTRLTFQITHATDSDTNEERDFLMGVLVGAGVVANVRAHEPGERVSIGRVNHYRTDGFVSVAELTGAGAYADEVERRLIEG
ncbi:MAG TPA: LssY C-terminal domain-containing protein [Roseiarcus sp.]|nr:LssY C-terminal domain-containing protein [Roseiarcus sp.]